MNDSSSAPAKRIIKTRDDATFDAAHFILDLEKDYNLQYIKLSAPKRIRQCYKEQKTKAFQYRLLYNNIPFLIQTPLSKVVERKVSTSGRHINEIVITFPIEYNFLHYQFFGAVDTIIRDSLPKDVELFNHIETDDNNNLEMILKLKATQNTIYSDIRKQKIDGFDIKAGDKIVALIETKGIYRDVDGTSATCKWTARDVLKWK
jgi:hypothetical protein